MEIQSHTSLHLVVLLHWYYIGITLVIHWYYIGILLQYWSPGIVLVLYCLKKASRTIESPSSSHIPISSI
jgi:hypothetical protein